MATPSKEEQVLKIILENSPLKEWHFENILREAKVTRVVASKWLKKYSTLGLLKRIKKRGKYPYYTAGSNNLVYYSWKKYYALKQFYESGLIECLLTLKNAKTIILFGSMIKGDWYKDSDIDIFIYGKANELNKNLYELRLQRHIELHIFENKKEIRKVKTGLINNVINGYLIKGKIQDLIKVYK